MKKGDIIWVLLLACWIGVLASPASRAVFINATKEHTYTIGFLKFAVLATMGEFLSRRLTEGSWEIPSAPLIRACIWGFLGMVFVLIFEVFSTGVQSALAKGFLLLPESKFAAAFLTSVVMNLAFAPTMMGFHRVSDTYLDLRERKGSRPALPEVIAGIDWDNFISFVVMKTIPFFWIPAHTITFLLPAVYRVIAAAFLSIVLGLILTSAKRKKGLQAAVSGA